mgnify:CR=1 FL=1
MANSTTVNKQNKLLLAALVVILAASAILVAVTGGANKKKTGENPPLEKQEEITDNEGEKSKEDVSLTDKTDGKKDDKAAEKTPDNTETSSDQGKNDGQSEAKQDKPNEKTDAITDNAVETAVQDDVLPKFTAPVDSIVIKGASLVTPVFSYTMNDYRTHGGLDFACSAGTPVCAAADGTVTEVSDDPMMGVTVALSHTGGAVTKYKGLAEETLAMMTVGDEVKTGDVIGVSGDTALIESAEENHVSRTSSSCVIKSIIVGAQSSDASRSKSAS